MQLIVRVIPLDAMSHRPLGTAASYLNSFHDGSIAYARQDEGGTLTLKINIQYLAQRIAADMRSFYLTLIGATLIRFEPWVGENEPEIALSPEDALNQSCEVLSAEVADDAVPLVLNQPNSQHGYSGGTVRLSLTGAKCRDELGNEYTTTAIADLADSYWKEWGSRHGQGAV